MTQFIWNELNVRSQSEGERCARFYAVVFGWNLRHGRTCPGAPTGPVFTSQGQPVGGLWTLEPQHGAVLPAQWISYIHVIDVISAAATVVAEGGTIVQPPFDLPGVGEFCVFRDPSGALAAMTTMGEGP
jgi:predicted enzyme related to lactoylglutathione lyase